MYQQVLSVFIVLLSIVNFTYAQETQVDSSVTRKMAAPNKIEAPEKIEAKYRVKASFFALPLKAKITIRKLEKAQYSADIFLKSPFFKVDQQEVARIQQCNVELVSVKSKGKRIGANDWDEKVQVKWPERQVTYLYDEGKRKEYRASQSPTGFTSFFAHQYTALFKKNKNKQLTYTQSSKGWETSFLYKGIDKKVANHYFDNAVSAERFVTPRPNTLEADMPTVWYMPAELASIPLKMAMKLGVFKLEVSLKDLNASKAEVQAFFSEWGCI